ncbi:hypothetical protein TSOC_001771 [Tetrabaena socialis]|uniref:Uncharacterized protein n=1 Tax=Tetrabaena socialis TaxID=47790 RepID=A0A2J8AFS7_9CHLO|nr:hypothetical protein TSOC_001771 [Tetrabaena socialis]|eukprot:PNH11374.1 hypothetical protein TSOC_001771 [Tetrabaena socialis]
MWGARQGGKPWLWQLWFPAARLGVQSYIEGRGLLMISDEAAVGAMVDRILAANDTQLQEIGGETRAEITYQNQCIPECTKLS